jgi:FAD/FMN-containing dehydrogenase
MPPYSDEGDPSCVFHSLRGAYLDRLSDEAMDTVLARFAEAPPGACEYGFDFDHYMHGQVCRVAPDATAFELRTPGAIHLAFGAGWREPEDTIACMRWLDQTWDMLQPFAAGRMYTNYASAEGVAATKAAYGSNYPRLAGIKRKYDPDNVFRRNLNILPK